MTLILKHLQGPLRFDCRLFKVKLITLTLSNHVLFCATKQQNHPSCCLLKGYKVKKYTPSSVSQWPDLDQRPAENLLWSQERKLQPARKITDKSPGQANIWCITHVIPSLWTCLITAMHWDQTIIMNGHTGIPGYESCDGSLFLP